VADSGNFIFQSTRIARIRVRALFRKKKDE
jgi:hypothetical protein